MTWVRRIAVAVVLPALLLDVVVATSTLGGVPSVVVGLLALALALRTLSTRRALPGPTYAVLAALVVAAAVAATQTAWSPTGSWGAVTLAGALAAVPRTRPLNAVLAGLGAVAVLAPFGIWSDLTIAVLFALAMTVALAVVVAAGLLLRAHELRVAETSRVVTAQERSRMAADLHDLVAHEVTGIAVLSRAVAPLATDAASQEALDTINRSAARAMEHIRELVAQVGEQEPSLSSPGSLESLRAIADRFAATSSAEVVVRLPELDPPARLGVVLERVLTEGLTNIRRHSGGATRVSVEISIDRADWVMRLTNDGAGTGGLGSGMGTGLVRLGDRVAAEGGELSSGPTGTDEWVVSARLPLQADTRSEP